MKPETILRDVIDPSLRFLNATLGGGPATTDLARVGLLAIAGQEAGWKQRRQVGGPARSYWQFESGGGVAGVMTKPSTGAMLAKVCAALDIPFDRPTIFEAMAWNDCLAVVMARLLLYSDPAPLPAIGEQDLMWNYYRRNWRPGKPHLEAWPAYYGAAVAAVLAAPPIHNPMPGQLGPGPPVEPEPTR